VTPCNVSVEKGAEALCACVVETCIVSEDQAGKVGKDRPVISMQRACPGKHNHVATHLGADTQP
jgi:hypothetical protein